MMSLRSRLSTVLHRARAGRRRSWRGPERFWVETKPIPEGRIREVAARIESELGALPGVNWARYNAAVGRVVIDVAEDGPDEHALRDAVEAVEAACGIDRQPLTTDPRSLPWDGATERRLQAELVTDVVSAVVAAAPRLRRERHESTKIDVAAALRLAEDVPAIRRVLDQWLGVRSADFALGVSNAISSASLNVVSGPVADALYRTMRLRAARAARQVWEDRERELGGAPGAHVAPSEPVPERVADLPDGPIETYTTRATLFSVGGSGVRILNARRLDAAAGAMISGVPRPAHYGRKAFTAALATKLARQGFLVMDARALRRLDRLDTLVVDGRLLALTTAEPDPDAEAMVAAARTHRLRLHVVTDAPDEVAWARPDAQIPTGPATLDALRVLQEERHGLGLVWLGADPALALADVSLGLPDGDHTPWGTHVIAPRGLASLALWVEAIGAAHRAATQSVQLTMLESVVGVALSLQDEGDAPSRRALTLSNVATIASMANAARLARGIEAPPPLRRRDRTPWHAMEPSEIFARLSTSEDGLPSELARGRAVPPPPPPTECEQVQRVLGDELDNPLAPVLAGGAALSALTGSKVDAAMVGGVLALNAVLGAAQRVRAERALSALDRAEARHVRVRRDGLWSHVPAAEIVVGDLLSLQAGELVPADCRVLRASGVELDESALTGESVPVRKSATPSRAAHIADRTSMLFAGTTVAAGDVLAVVVAVGEDTEARAAVAGTQEHAPRGVEARLRALTGLTAPIAALAGGALLVTGLARRGKPRELIGSAVSLSVAAVPEGLPLLAMVAQLAAARRLAGRGALARNPRAIEALGRVDLLCADKTGTLTEGRLRVQVVSDGRLSADVDALPLPLLQVLSAAARATPAPRRDDPLPHPTDQAVVEGWWTASGTSADVAPVRHAELPFEPGRGWHATLSDSLDGARLDVKGSPEAVLARCTKVRSGGRTRALSAREQTRLHEHATSLGERGLRVLAVATRSVDASRTWIHAEDVHDLVFLGFLGIADPPRASAASSVEALRSAGVSVVMITGDHASTAGAIAKSLGLRTTRVATGAELERLDDDALDRLLPDVSVFARVTPAQKVRLVRAYQRLGHVVAMTGDGANDAPAIRQADVGIALGERATMAARHAAALVVADGHIETIVAALLEGRALWASVRDAVGMLVGSNLGEVAYTLFGGLVTGRVPLNARQLLLVNLLTDALPALALAARPPSTATPESLAKAGPEASLGSELERDILYRALFTAGAAGVGWSVARWTLGRRGADTVGLLSLVGTQLGQTALLAEGSADVLLTSVGSLALLLALVEFPPTSLFFGCRPLGPTGLAQAAVAAGLGTVAAAVVPPLVDELRARLEVAWREHHLDDSELVRWIAESRTLHRMAERGAELRLSALGLDPSAT